MQAITSRPLRVKENSETDEAFSFLEDLPLVDTLFTKGNS
jgi:hypothetical protein